jgi:enolase
MNNIISEVKAVQVLDSRWNPTVRTKLTFENGYSWIATVPSWASTWAHEAIELRDNDKSKYNGKWVLKAVENVNKFLSTILRNKDFEDYKELDEYLIRTDHTTNKSELGANAMLWVSMAYCRADAKSRWQKLHEYLGWGNTLPVPMMNILNGWEHATNNVDIQEFMIVPTWAESIADAVEIGSEVTRILKDILIKKWVSTWVGDEGGFAPNLKSNEEALQLIMKAIEKGGYEKKVELALDCAASEFYNKETKLYELKWEWKEYTAEELIAYYEKLLSKYPIISIEDGLYEDDILGWKQLTEKLGNKVQLVWDDLFVTNVTRLEQIWVKLQVANSILIKPNQIGTVSETIDAINMAHANNMTSVISHRSWESWDTFIADLAVWMNSGQIKTWAPCRGERTEKYNRLIEIEAWELTKSQYWK